MVNLTLKMKPCLKMKRFISNKMATFKKVQRLYARKSSGARKRNKDT
jgi:hypothetical protein